MDMPTAEFLYYAMFESFNLQDLDKVQDLLLGNTGKKKDDKYVLQGLFQDRKHNNFFNVSAVQAVHFSSEAFLNFFKQKRNLKKVHKCYRFPN